MLKHKEINEEPDESIKEDIVKSIAHEYTLAFNIIEDQRIESLTKHVWLGTQKMFDETRTNLGKRLEENLKGIPVKERSPSDKLLAARFFQPNLSEDWANEIMEDVLDVGTRGSLTAWVRSKYYVDKYLEDGYKDYNNNKEKIKELTKQENESNEIITSSTATQEEIDQASQNSIQSSTGLRKIRIEF
jgi:hypothetical protein